MAAKRVTYHHGNLRAALIEASLEIIEEKGVRALTLREIGTRVGVSRMAAYRHFADKADLVSAIGEAGFSQFADALEEARRSVPEDPVARLEAMALAYVRFAAAHRAHFEVMFSPESRPNDLHAEKDPPPKDSAGERAFAILEETIREAQERGQVRQGNSEELARLVWAMVHGLSVLRLEPDLSENGAGTKFTRYCAEVLGSGLAPR